MPVPAATFCPEVSIPGRFPIPLPSSDCCCSEPLQRSRFTSHKSVWRWKGSGGVPGKGRERRLSLPLPQTLSRCPGQAAAGPPVVTQPPASPSACPVSLERCPKWIKEPPRENEPAAIPQPASRQWGPHRCQTRHRDHGPACGDPERWGHSHHSGTRAELSPLCSSSGSASPKAPAAPFQGSAQCLLTDPHCRLRAPPSCPDPKHGHDHEGFGRGHEQSTLSPTAPAWEGCSSLHLLFSFPPAS